MTEEGGAEKGSAVAGGMVVVAMDRVAGELGEDFDAWGEGHSSLYE